MSRVHNPVGDYVYGLFLPIAASRSLAIHQQDQKLRGSSLETSAGGKLGNVEKVEGLVLRICTARIKPEVVAVTV